MSGWPKSPREIAADAVALFHEQMTARGIGYNDRERIVTIAIAAVVETLVAQFMDYDSQRRDDE